MTTKLDPIIVKVRMVNWQTLGVLFGNGREEFIPLTPKMARRMEDRTSAFFYATETDGKIKLGKFAPWQPEDFGAKATA